MTSSGSADQTGQTTSQPKIARAFRPGPGFVVLLVVAALVIVLALAAAIAAALGAHGVSGILGGLALVLVGVGLLATLRVPARSLVVNAPRLRLERNRARVARRRARGSAEDGRAASVEQQGAAPPGRDLAVPLTVPGTDIAIPESTGRRELTALDVASGPSDRGGR